MSRIIAAKERGSPPTRLKVSSADGADADEDEGLRPRGAPPPRERRPEGVGRRWGGAGGGGKELRLAAAPPPRPAAPPRPNLWDPPPYI